jgi:hypothetical protein
MRPHEWGTRRILLPKGSVDLVEGLELHEQGTGLIVVIEGEHTPGAEALFHGEAWEGQA